MCTEGISAQEREFQIRVIPDHFLPGPCNRPIDFPLKSEELRLSNPIPRNQKNSYISVVYEVKIFRRRKFDRNSRILYLLKLKAEKTPPMCAYIYVGIYILYIARERAEREAQQRL